ncbi:hypothetical protein [Streptomyces sp. DH20]|uniref:hypothetical protein n=1 Tax=Streptomyces sp. DH20 TaxID=2857009 RepID=UPI001E61DBA6|nr:hypothetical protein [Streptomyces sp. DH20]
MTKKNRKHPSARDRRRARQAAARVSRTAACSYPLFAHRPPYTGYGLWLTPKSDARDVEDLPVAAATVLAMVRDLAPLYQDQVPTAALYLEQQIRAGVLHVATGQGAVTSVPVPDMATVLAETAHYFSEEPVPDGADGEDVGRMLHELHALGALVVDDNVIRLAVLV